tara:strand:+ start:333 stop:1214 length:882 start_codon:yes stop_codon:yes gene_type:complete
MAFLGGIGKKLGLGSTSDVLEFGANAAATYYSGGAVPLQTTPFERSEPQQMNPYELQSRNMRMQQEVPQRSGSSFGNFFSNIGESLGSFSQGLQSFTQEIPPMLSLFGGGSGFQRTNSGTATTINMKPPSETSSSGEFMGANLGLAPALFQAGRSLLRTPGGQTALGFGAGALGAVFSGGGNTAPRITRRMKSDVRRIYMMAGMDPNITAQILNSMGTYPRMDFDASLVFFILTKRFRNDGPVVTKAAVRKTRTTLRRMKGVVDTYNSVCKPTAPRRRAAPSRSKAVQLISNK